MLFGRIPIKNNYYRSNNLFFEKLKITKDISFKNINKTFYIPIKNVSYRRLLIIIPEHEY